MITMSALPRLLACAGSAVLPRAENASEWADLGNEEHDDLSDLAALPPELAKHVPAGARSEVKVAYDVATRVGRIIGDGAGRSYGTLAPFEIPGSIDVLGIDGDAVIVVDWKTGYLDVEPAATNGQLWGYGLAAARALGRDRAILRVVYTKTGRVDEYEADGLELAAFADRLERLHVRIAALRAARGEPVSTSEGTWCRHCPSKPSCPSKNGLLIQLAERGLAVIGDAQMTPERAADGVREFLRVDQLVKDARKRLIAYVDENGPIDLGNGRAYGRYEKTGDERLDGDKAVQAIREVVGKLDADLVAEFHATAIEHRTSKAALGRAAKAIHQKPKLATAVIKRIRELGGITNASPERPVGEFSLAAPPQELPAADIAEVDRLLSEAG